MPYDWIDISMPLRPGMPTYPGDPPFEQAVEIFTDPSARESLQTSQLKLGTHTGTHLDAPRHVFAAGDSIDQIDLDLFCGPARVLDLRGRGPGLEVADLGDGAWDGVERLLLRTDNSQRPDEGFRGGSVHLTLAAAEFLRRETRIRLLGIDGLSIEAADSAGLPVHRCLLQGRPPIAILEGVDLGQTPAGDYLLVCLPLCIVGGDGAPARALLRRI